MLSQHRIKNENLKHIYSTVHACPGISRAQLSKQVHLSKATVSSLVDELIEHGFLMDSGNDGSPVTIGRRPNCLHVRSGAHYVLVLHWLENAVHAHLIDIVSAITCQEDWPVGEGLTYVDVSKDKVDAFIEATCHKDRLLGICVVVSAMIDAKHNEIFSTTLSLPAMGSGNLLDELRDAFPEQTVAIFDDTACCAYAEKVYANIGEDNFAFVNFGRGIGATLFIEGRMLGRASSALTQFGHYSVNPQGPLCACGNRGCLETLISESSLTRRRSEFGRITQLEINSSVSYADLGHLATFRNPAALSWIKQMASELSMALANMISIANPSLIVLGGAIPDLGAVFLEEVRRQLTTIGFRKMVDAVEVRYSTMPNDAYLIGAMRYFLDVHYCFAGENEERFFIG